MINKILFIALFQLVSFVYAQDSTLVNDNWSITINPKGAVQSLIYKKSGNQYLFNKDEFVGPDWYIQLDDKLIQPKFIGFRSKQWRYYYDNMEFAFGYNNDKGKLVLVATIKSYRKTPFQPQKIGLRLGLNNYMDKYPDWESRLFPTLLRCEKTHFWGYFMSPPGKILLIASPDPIASWSHNYSTEGRPPYEFSGHRITSVNLDLINQLPLPERHPQNLYQVKPGEVKTFRIYFDEKENLSQIVTDVAEITSAPAVDMQVTSCEKGRAIEFLVYSQQPEKVTVVTPNNETILLTPAKSNATTRAYRFDKTMQEGNYQIFAEANGKITQANIYVRKNYSWYMGNAINAVVTYPQKASLTHCESWYGFYTAFAGGKYFPANENVVKANKQFDQVLPVVFDTVKFEPVKNKFRIQNTSTLIGVLVDRYQLYKNENDIKLAVRFADVLMQSQTSDGAYRAHKTHYTSVIYIAKSLMELLEVLKTKEQYKDEYTKIYNSVKLAMDELERNKTDIQTEGEQTFEDGMISCTALQLAQFALMQDNKKDQEKYTNAAKAILKQHACLEQLVIPDARMRSASLRFWEAQYDVLMNNNYFNSPHGWSSWTTYANYYLYQLTGNIEYLTRMFNGLDAAMQIVKLENGSIRWAFMVNPHVEVVQVCRNVEGATPLAVPGTHYQALMFAHEKYIMGEDYVDMVSDWFFANANDNDVHEHFKCLEEVALNKAYVAEKENGELVAYNCSVSKEKGRLVVTLAEPCINTVHFNLKSNWTVELKGAKKVTKSVTNSMEWVSL